jgi:hypothetical protein
MQANTVNNFWRQEKAIYWFLFLWTLLNVLQACTFGLHSDEAYYWIYSRFLDWGYFDHPPMVALFIRAGDSMMHNELGLRLVNILSSTVTMYLLWKIVKKYNNDAFWFILVTAGMFTLNIYGFITTPDGPLLLFTVLFLYVYQQYLEKNKWWQALLLGLIVAGLLYSKYHAVLLIGFAVLANIKLLARWSFWLIVVMAAALYLPHILWQINHDYPSLAYHLSDRTEKVYKFEYTSTYVISQLLMAGPFVGWFMFYKGFTVRAGDAFLRALKVIFIGVMLFFLASTLKGRVQPQWTIIALAALAILVPVNFAQKGDPPVWLRKLAIASFSLIIAVRLLLVMPPPFIKNIEAVQSYYYYHDWAKTVKQKVGNNWLVMNDGFQVPSKYCYYNNTFKCFSYDSRYYRLTQFEIWPMEDSIQGKRAYYLLHGAYPGLTTDTVQTAAGPWYGLWIDDVRTYQRVAIKPAVPRITSAPGKKHTISLTISNPYNHPISFSNTEYKNAVFLEACFFDGEIEAAVQQAGTDFNNIRLQPGQTANYNFTITAPQKKGSYDLLFSIHTVPFNGSKNSRAINFTVE